MWAVGRIALLSWGRSAPANAPAWPATSGDSAPDEPPLAPIDAEPPAALPTAALRLTPRSVSIEAPLPEPTVELESQRSQEPHEPEAPEPEEPEPPALPDVWPPDIDPPPCWRL